MINITAIDHVNLMVSSLSTSREYYHRVFNLSFSPREGMPDVLVAESPGVHFFLTECRDVPANILSRQHISFSVTSLEKVIGELEKMDIRDYETGKVDFMIHNNYTWCEWRDLDGIRLECVEHE